MKYIKSYHLIKESLFKDVESSIKKIKKLANERSEISKEIDDIKDSLSEQKDQIIQSINKCLDILSKHVPENVRTEFAEEDLDDVGIELDGISNIFDFFYFFEKGTDDYWGIYNTDDNISISLVEFDIIDLYELLKILISIPEISAEVNKGALLNLNK